MPADNDPLRRRQRKAQTVVPAHEDIDNNAEAIFKVAPTSKKASLPNAKPIDYSRFNDLTEEAIEVGRETGRIDWDDLNKKEKSHIFDMSDRMEQMLDQKRQEEDAWKRQLKEKPADLSWVQGRHFASYEVFCVARVEATLKKTGNEAYKNGHLEQARTDWEAGVQMLLALGTIPPEGHAMICVLRNNLAQLHVKLGEWGRVKELTDKVLDREPTNEKALYRRAQAFAEIALWHKAEIDLELLLKYHSLNKDALFMLEQVQNKLGKDRRALAGKAVRDIAAGMAELAPDGTIRKLKIEQYGDGDPDDKPSWFQSIWLEEGAEKAVVTCQMVITSHGGEELYNSREYRPFPETKKARDELKEYMDMVNFLDQEAGKKPRLVGDFYRRVKKRPVRWHLGDPGMCAGFDIAVRSMKVGEKALFEVDQPQLAPSVEAHYRGLGFHSTLAGLPQLVYHIEEERLQILEDELPAEELDLDSKTQRGVRVELELLGFLRYRDISDGSGSVLRAVLHTGLADAPFLRRGELIRGAFFINRPFDGGLLVQNTFCEWRLGDDEGFYACEGEHREPLRPDGGAFVPRCVGQALLAVMEDSELRAGCLVEVRTRVGPELHEIAPQYAEQFEQARRENHKRGRRGGAPCSILVQTFPMEHPPPVATVTADLAHARPADMDLS